MARTSCFVLVATLAICLQKAQAEPFFQMFQHDKGQAFGQQVAPAQPAGPNQANHQVHHQAAGHFQQGFFNFPAGGHFNLGKFDFHHQIKQMKEGFLEQYAPMISSMQVHHSPAHRPRIVLNRTVAVNIFYEDCGLTTRQCHYVHHPQGQKIDQPQEEATSEYQHQCFNIKNICVGNTETCVNDRSCVVAMKIKEVAVEGGKRPIIASVAHINNCHMEGQSITDGSRTPQMFFGVGFATYDESGQIECRSPSASDFKLVYLWKNSSDAIQDNGHCQTPPEKDISSVSFYDTNVIRSVDMWRKACLSGEKKEGTFNLKTFLSKHTPTAHYTSFFSPPFDFADNYQPESSSNNMVISGVVQ